MLASNCTECFLVFFVFFFLINESLLETTDLGCNLITAEVQRSFAMCSA